MGPFARDGTCTGIEGKKKHAGWQVQNDEEREKSD